MRALIIALLCVVLSPLAEAKVVTLKTKDKLKITAEWHPPKTKKYGAVIALHSLKSTRKAWAPLIKHIAPYDVGLLTIDLRGFGSSKRTGKMTKARRKKMKDTYATRNMWKDVAAGIAFLKRKGIPPQKVILVGAELGATVALDYAARSKKIHGAVILTPRQKLHDISSLKHAKAWGERPLLIIASKNQSKLGARAIYDNVPKKKRVILLLLPKENLDGVTMLTAVKSIPDRLMEWASIQLGRPINQ